MPDATTLNGLDLLADLVARARRRGADAADALFAESVAASVARRLGKPEAVERAESRDLGLRVFVGRRQAVVSSSDTASKALDELVERAVAMARAATEDRFAGLADPDQIAREWPALDIEDPAEPATEALIERARAVEEAALAVPGVTNSEGGEAAWGLTRVALAASNGFAGAYARTSHSVSVSVLAGSGTAMERDYDYSSVVHGSDLEDPAAVGRRAGEKAVRRLNPKKTKTAQMPVVFDPRVGQSIAGHLASAVNGTAVARGTSFLKDRMGDVVFAEGITIVDDGLRPRGLRSRPFDGEGLASRRTVLVDRGVLRSWVLDLSAARQLGVAPTGHASRGTSGPPGPSTSNLYIEAGTATPEALMADIADGFYVTDLMGFGISMVTGDYSRGAAGFRIENGALTHPVSEVTIAGNLKDMFRRAAVANDLVFRYGTNVPTLRIDGMTVAGT